MSVKFPILPEGVARSERELVRFRAELSEAQRVDFDHVVKLSKRVTQFTDKYLQYDWNDIFHIFERMDMNPSQRFSMGIRRRTISVRPAESTHF